MLIQQKKTTKLAAAAAGIGKMTEYKRMKISELKNAAHGNQIEVEGFLGFKEDPLNYTLKVQGDYILYDEGLSILLDVIPIIKDEIRIGRRVVIRGEYSIIKVSDSGNEEFDLFKRILVREVSIPYHRQGSLSIAEQNQEGQLSLTDQKQPLEEKITYE